MSQIQSSFSFNSDEENVLQLKRIIYHTKNQQKMKLYKKLESFKSLNNDISFILNQETTIENLNIRKQALINFKANQVEKLIKSAILPFNDNLDTCNLQDLMLLNEEIFNQIKLSDSLKEFQIFVNEQQYLFQNYKELLTLTQQTLDILNKLSMLSMAEESKIQELHSNQTSLCINSIRDQEEKEECNSEYSTQFSVNFSQSSKEKNQQHQNLYNNIDKQKIDRKKLENNNKPEKLEQNSEFIQKKRKFKVVLKLSQVIQKGFCIEKEKSQEFALKIEKLLRNQFPFIDKWYVNAAIYLAILLENKIFNFEEVAKWNFIDYESLKDQASNFNLDQYKRKSK